MLTQDENLAGLAALNRELLARVDAIESSRRVVLDIDSTEVPVYGQQEQSAYNGHFESTCYHPLLLFNREGDCLAVKLRPGNVRCVGGLRGGMEVVSEKSAANAAMPGVRDRGRTRTGFRWGLPGSSRTTGRARVFRWKEFRNQNGNSS